MPLPPVYKGESSLLLGEILTKIAPSSLVILVDENTEKYCLPQIIGTCRASVQHVQLISIPAGEKYKNIETTARIWSQMMAHFVDRKSFLLALGGGVVTDIGGFAAACYKRGITFGHIPTTILAMVDAAIGGKTGVDHAGIKNSVGAFVQPEFIITDTSFLQTLPYREFLSGFAEVYKHGLIDSKTHWQELKKQDLKQISKVDLSAIIAKSQAIKLKICNEDPLEKHLRKCLNLGHSIGHAIESLFLEHEEGSLLHGEAIAIGMVIEAYISTQCCGLMQEEATEIYETLSSVYKMPVFKQDQIKEMISLIKNDKKNQNQRIEMSLLKAIGEPAIAVVVSQDLVSQSFDWYNKYFA